LLTQVAPVIASQIFGGFLAALLVLGMFWEEVQHVTDNALAHNIPLVSAKGPAAILIPIPGDNQNNLGFLLLYVESQFLDGAAGRTWPID